MKEYTKIETLNKREESGNHKLIEGSFRNETVEFLKDVEWIGTEKVDGTNIGVVWDGHRVSFQGRTEKADIPSPLLETLEEKFGGNVMEEVFEQIFGDNQVILFGEGYGNKINKIGNKYLNNKNDFILFDVYFPEKDLWLKRESLEDIATKLNIKIVPIIFRGSLEDGIKFVKSKPLSIVAESDLVIEGIVCRPRVDIKDRMGNRVIVKIKVCDYE